MEFGTGIDTLDTLVLYTMSKEAAELVKQRFIELGANGESVSYMDCVLFDSALEVLGEEQEYYGYADDEWADIIKQRNDALTRFKTVKTIDVTDTWREVLS